MLQKWYRRKIARSNERLEQNQHRNTTGTGEMVVHGYNLIGSSVYVNGFPAKTNSALSTHRSLSASVPSLRNFDMEESDGWSWITLDNNGRVSYVKTKLLLCVNENSNTNTNAQILCMASV